MLTDSKTRLDQLEIWVSGSWGLGGGSGGLAAYFPLKGAAYWPQWGVGAQPDSVVPLSWEFCMGFCRQHLRGPDSVQLCCSKTLKQGTQMCRMRLQGTTIVYHKHSG